MRKVILVSGVLFLIGAIILGVVFFWFQRELSVAHTLYRQDGTYLVVFQNAMELRPTGGFLGNFAEVTVKNGQIMDYQIYNTNEFDRGKDGLEPPVVYKDMLGVTKWQLRDANWDPDFPTTAEQIIDLYELEGGEHNILGVIAIDSHVLPMLLDYLGEIKTETFPEGLTSDNVLWRLQYELNVGFREQGLEQDERKQAFREVFQEVVHQLQDTSFSEKREVFHHMKKWADKKHILAYHRDSQVQGYIESLDWAGNIHQDSDHYFALIDANLGALKTDYVMERRVNMDIKDCEQGLCYTTTLKYHNTQDEATKLTDDYISYTRVLLPEEAVITDVQGIGRNGQVDFETLHGRLSAGFQVIVPVGEKHEVTVKYHYPQQSQQELYIQKQPGLKELPISIQYNDFSTQGTLTEDTSTYLPN